MAASVCGDEADVSVVFKAPLLVLLIHSQSGIIDIDEIQAHGRPLSAKTDVVWLILFVARYWSHGYRQAQIEQYSHCCCNFIIAICNSSRDSEADFGVEFDRYHQ